MMSMLPVMTSIENTLQRVDVILNGAAGTFDKEAIAERVHAFFSTRGVAARTHLVRSGNDLLGTAQRAATGDAQVVVAGGGDGTIAAVARHLVLTDKALGVLPLGTFNYFARNLGLPLELDGALDIIALGAYATISIGV